MTDAADFGEDRYYRHTGRTPFVGSTLAAVGAWVVVSLLGFAYAYADLYIKLVDILSLLILVAFAAAMGFAVYGILRWGQVRNMAVVAIVSLSAGLLGWYASWVTWEHALIAREETPPPLWEMAQKPAAVYELAAHINGFGTFSLRKRVVKGTELWVAWGIEALVIIGAITVIPIRGLREQAFCENCKTWTRRQKGVLRLGHGDEDVLRQQAEAKNLDHFEQLGLVDAERAEHFRVDLFDCPRCDQTRLMTISRVTVSYNNKNQRQESVTKVVDRLRLTGEESAEVRDLPQTVAARAAQAAASAGSAPGDAGSSAAGGSEPESAEGLSRPASLGTTSPPQPPQRPNA